MSARVFTAVLGGLLLLTCDHLPGRAGPFDNKPKILIHLAAPTAKNPCTASPLADCLAAQTTGTVSTASGPFYFAYLLEAKGNLTNVGGFAFGIDYDLGPTAGAQSGSGVDVLQWTECVSVPYHSLEPRWPAPGSGMMPTTWGRIKLVASDH